MYIVTKNERNRHFFPLKHLLNIAHWTSVVIGLFLALASGTQREQLLVEGNPIVSVGDDPDERERERERGRGGSEK